MPTLIYSTDDEEIEERKREADAEVEWNTLPYSDVDRSKSTWPSVAQILFWQNVRRFQWLGFGVGEFFADMLGITSPRYQSALAEAERLEEENNRQDRITQHCYVNDAGELVPHQAVELEQTRVAVPQTIELDHKGQEVVRKECSNEIQLQRKKQHDWG